MIKLVGIPYDSNSSFLKGPAMAPSRIRLMDADGSANRFCEQGKEITEGTTYVDLGDILLAENDPQLAFAGINQKIKEEIENGDKIICFGGDHSVSFPIIDAFTSKYPDLNVLHLDAHGDLYDNFDNNPFSHASPFARLMEKGQVKSLTQVGIRTLTTHQKEQADKFKVEIIEMKDFYYGFLKKLKGPLYVSLDIDVLDPAFAPGVSHHEPGGLSSRQLITIIQAIAVPIVGADIVELNPVRDLNNMTAMVAYKLFKELVARMSDYK
jgi:agmatinase